MGPLPRPLAPSPTPDHTQQGLARGRGETVSWELQLKAKWEVDRWVGSRAAEAPLQGRCLCTQPLAVAPASRPDLGPPLRLLPRPSVFSLHPSQGYEALWG